MMRTPERRTVTICTVPRLGLLALAALALVLFAGVGPTALAQDETQAPESVGVVETPEPEAAPDAQPPAEPEAVADADAAQPSEPAPAVEAVALKPGQVLLNFRDATLTTVLNYLSETAGLAVIEEVSVDGRITVFSRQPLSVAEAVSLLNTVLKEKGYAAVRTGRTLTIVTLEEAKRRNIPVRSGNDPSAIADSDEMITQVIPIRYADAVRLKDDLSTLISPYADLTANQSSNALILTDTGANIRRIVQIIQALDTTMSAVTDVRVYQLEYADAMDAARLINDVFKVDEGAGGRQSARSPMERFFRGQRGEGQQQQQQGLGAQMQKVTASADDRTNTVVVSGPPETLDVVEYVIKELDANPAQEEGVMTYAVKNGQATNIADVMNDLLGESRTTTGGRTTSRGGQSSRRQQFIDAMRGRTSASTQTASAGLAGQVYVVADDDTNTLLVLTAPENFDTVRAILEELDKPVPQVLIKVLIAEVTHDRMVDLGVEFSLLNLGGDGRGSALFTDFGIADQSGGLIYKLVRGDVTAALRALEELGKLEVLSRPYILTSDNQEASITVGQEVPFIRNTRTTETGQTINTIQYEDIGIILNVTPHINPDGLVTMDVSPEISSTTGSTVPISETVDAEVFAKRSAQSRVAVRDGQTIVIGGLIEDRKTETVRKVPFLGDIPVVGALFRRTKTDKVKTELLIFLTPHVAHRADDLEAMSADEREGMQVVPNAVDEGVFDRHMEGMKRGANGQTTQAEE